MATAWRDVLRRLVWTCGCIVAVHAGFALATLLQAGEWPQWQRYFELVAAYTPAGEGLGLEAVPPSGAWIAMAAVYVASLLGCLLVLPQLRSRRGTAAVACVAGVTLMGVAQLSIFVGKSTPERLYSAAVPLVIVLAFWSDRLSRRGVGSAPTRFVVASSAHAALFLCFLQLSPWPREWWEHDSERSLGSTRIAKKVSGCAGFPACLWDPPAATFAAAIAEQMILEMVPEDAPLAVFLSSRATTELLIRTGRPHAFPLNKPFQDGLVPSQRTRIANAPHRLEAGDLIFVKPLLLSGTNRANRLSKAIVKRLCEREFECVPERGGRFVHVFRLQPRS